MRQITAPSELVVLMSALQDDEVTVNSDGTSRYRFKQPVPVPSYLIAIAVGNLESRKVGPRSHVWSEPEFIDAAAFEFSEVCILLSSV